MCGLLINAGLLMLVVKMVLDEDVEFSHAVLTIIVASLAGLGAQWGVASLIGANSTGVIAGIVADTAATALTMGVAISFFLGASFKRACIAGAVFIGVKIAIVIVLVLVLLAMGTGFPSLG